MPELRQDPTTKEWVIIATERAKRPHEFQTKEQKRETASSIEFCPFCPGNESLTPPEVLAFRHQGGANEPGWWLRVVPNKFAALVPEGSYTRRTTDHIFVKMDGVGLHEVVIESPSHSDVMALMGLKQVEEVLFAYRLRFHALKQEGGVKAIIIFKNHGVAAGTSLEHPHSQIVATPIVPLDIRNKHEVAMHYYDDTGACIYCVTRETELEARVRIVEESEHFVSFHPFASRAPFETAVYPKRHNCSFGRITDEEVRDLARVLRSILRRLYFGLGNPDFNYVIHTAPLEDEDKEYYLWHLQILPRLTTTAGFEIGSGIYITTALPEETAAFMREITV